MGEKRRKMEKGVKVREGHTSKKDKSVGCSECGRIMKRSEALFMKRSPFSSSYFCSQSCAYNRSRKTMVCNIVAFLVSVCMVVAILHFAVPWDEVFPEEGPRYSPSMDHIGLRDIVFKNVRPHNDGYHTELEVEILITNRGKGDTGTLFVDVFAENTTSRVIDDTFNTSMIRYVENGTNGHVLPSQKSGKVNGDLVLRPGEHLIYFRIYEDGLRGFIEGQRSIEVTEDQIVMQPWQESGRSGSSRDVDDAGASEGSSAPGFEAVGVLVAVMAVLVVKRLGARRARTGRR